MQMHIGSKIVVLTQVYMYILEIQYDSTNPKTKLYACKMGKEEDERESFH